MTHQKIIHVDMDCFYAAVEMRDNPYLRDKPIAVGGGHKRGVLTTANYKARKYGVHSAMPVAQALKLCPQLILTPVNFSKYKAESRKIRKIFHQFTNFVEPLSLDEAYLDVSDCMQFNGSATLIAQEIRKLIFENTNLTASAGIAPNKFLAKVASDWKKPNGQFTIRPKDVSSFVLNLPVKKIPGVGKVTAEKMKKLSIETCTDLQSLSITDLEYHFGSWGVRLYDLARGVDCRKVSVGGERKSLSVENTYEDDLKSAEQCLEKLPKLFADFKQRLDRSGESERISALMVKVKFYDFQSTSLEKSSLKTPSIESFSQMIEEAFYRENKPVRLLGIGVKLKSINKRVSISSQLNLDFC